ncbi:protein singed wings 2 isoform X1 [Contarinia nasturtii]|uniref:protein singed wings 2 isoform X1 n=1 Tax=Contarinia nasturtii TaxID=265458 RepID=UPI0012D4BF66|nr:protein singed wings 2 isoform X1 [Contarinia nasturtii]
MHPKYWMLTVVVIVLHQITISKSVLAIDTPPEIKSTNSATENWICTTNDAQQGKCTWNNRTLICHGTTLNITSIKLKRIQEAIFCGWPNEKFDPTILKQFPKLTSLHIENGSISQFALDFPHLKHLKHINISNTRISHLHSTHFKHLPAVRTIDLRKNQLDYYDGSLVLSPKIHELYLSENPYNCSKNFKWITHHNDKTKFITDRSLLLCSDTTFKNQSILTVMNFKIAIREMCRKNRELHRCTCTLSFLSVDLDAVSHPMYAINCSHLNLTHLPTTLPENTTTFYAQHNQISDVEPLLNAYGSVHDIYLDFNHISTIEILENDNFLERFRAFSLKGNRLKKLPVYLLNNALERNHHADSWYLSENPWRCECDFMLKFQDLLQSHRSVIKDASEIQCIKHDGDNTILYPVLALKRHDICISTEHTIQPIDMLNVVLATLIIFIICKLTYDYYNFRVRGHLPWIVTKIP